MCPTKLHFTIHFPHFIYGKTPNNILNYSPLEISPQETDVTAGQINKLSCLTITNFNNLFDCRGFCIYINVRMSELLLHQKYRRRFNWFIFKNLMKPQLSDMPNTQIESIQFSKNHFSIIVFMWCSNSSLLLVCLLLMEYFGWMDALMCDFEVSYLPVWVLYDECLIHKINNRNWMTSTRYFV